MRRDVRVNAVLLQAAWFAAVLGGNTGALAACAVVAAHVLSRGHPQRDLTIAAMTAAIGLGVDTAWIWTGVLDFHLAVVAPPWIVALWACVGLSANYAFAPCVGRPWSAAAIAAVACPLSYLAAASLGALALPAPPMLAVIAAGWAIVFGVLLGFIAPFFNRQFEELI